LSLEFAETQLYLVEIVAHILVESFHSLAEVVDDDFKCFCLGETVLQLKHVVVQFGLQQGVLVFVELVLLHLRDSKLALRLLDCFKPMLSPGLAIDCLL